MAVRWLAIAWLALALAGCGRIGFDPLTGEGGAGDASGVDAINATGQLDPTFGGTGIVQPSSSTGDSRAYDVIARGRNVVVTGTDFASNTSMDIISLSEDGTRDMTFASGGELIAKPSSGSTGFGYGMTGALADGSILLLGDGYFTSTDNMIVGKISAGGAMQSSFGGVDGFVNVDVNLNDTAVRAAVVGNVAYVCGDSNYSNDRNFTVVAIRTADGTLDSSFQAAGILDTNYSVAGDECADIKSYGAGLLAAATNNGTIMLVSISVPTGSTNFSTGVAGTARSLALRSDNRIIVAGETGSAGLLVQFDTAASLDPSFGSGGVVSVSGDLFFDMALDDAGRIVAVGRRNGDPLVSRFLSNGSPDPSFGTNGSFVLGQTGLLNGVVIDSVGRIIAVGSVNDGMNHLVVLRLH